MAMSLIFFAKEGSDFSRAATLVSSPMAMSVTLPGRRLISVLHEINRSTHMQGGTGEAIRPAGLINGLGFSGLACIDRNLAPGGPASQSNLAAKRARA